MSSRPAYFTSWILGQPRLCNETLSQNTNNNRNSNSNRPVTVKHACNPSIWKAKLWGLSEWGQPWLYNDNLSKRQKERGNRKGRGAVANLLSHFSKWKTGYNSITRIHSGGRRCGSAVKKTSCSFRERQFSSQHCPTYGGSASNCQWLQFLGLAIFFWPLEAPLHSSILLLNI